MRAGNLKAHHETLTPNNEIIRVTFLVLVKCKSTFLSSSRDLYVVNKRFIAPRMSCEVEVPTVSTAVPPSVPESETAEDVCTETTVPVPSPTYEWFCGLPIAASAGSAFSNFYEASKNYNTVTQYTLGTVEGSVKKAASVVAPVIHKLDGPSKF